MAIIYGMVFLAQLDGTLTALDAKNGSVLWKSDYETAYRRCRLLFLHHGVSGLRPTWSSRASSDAECAIPNAAFVQAYDAGTGKLIWRFRTTARQASRVATAGGGDSYLRGGGSVWSTPAIDPAHGLVSFAVGNPNPDLDGHDRLGDNAYTDSIVGIGVADGKLRWWNQEVPHDLWDYDSAAPVIFMDARDASGKMVPAAAEAGKTGNVFSIVNRLTGEDGCLVG